MPFWMSHRRLLGAARLEQLDHPRQAAGDVLGFGRLARNLHQNLARVHLLSVLHHQVRAGGQHVLALGALAADEHRRRALLRKLRLDDDALRQAGDLVGVLAHVLALDDVLELHRAGDLGQHRGGERIPVHQLLTRRDLLALLHRQV
jgi:hypothetical protein